MKISAWQALIAIIGITAIGAGCIVGLEIAHLDITPIVALITPTLVVLVGLLKLDAQIAINSQKISEVADATNGKLDAALAIVAANNDKEGEVNGTGQGL